MITLTRLRLATLLSLGLTLQAGCLGDAEGGATEEPPRSLLVGLGTDPAVDPDWSFSYDDQCRLVRIDLQRRPVFLPSPLEYQHALGLRGAGESISFAYDDASLLSELILVDSINGLERVQGFAPLYVRDTLRALVGTPVLVDGRLSPQTPIRIEFFRGAAGVVDSVAYSSGRTVRYLRSDLGNIERAVYRGNSSIDGTAEFHEYVTSARNPFAGLPMRFVFTYAGYWSPQPPTLSSFGLRSFDHNAPDGILRSTRELTFGDEAANLAYDYEVRVCP